MHSNAPAKDVCKDAGGIGVYAEIHKSYTISSFTTHERDAEDESTIATVQSYNGWISLNKLIFFPCRRHYWCAFSCFIRFDLLNDIDSNKTGAEPARTTATVFNNHIST